MATTWESPGAVMSTPGPASRQHSHALRTRYHDEPTPELGPEVAEPYHEYRPRKIVQYLRGYMPARNLDPSDIRTLVMNDGAWPAPQQWPATHEGPVGFDEDAPVSLRGGVMALVAGVSFGAGLFVAWSAMWAPAVAAGVGR